MVYRLRRTLFIQLGNNTKEVIKIINDTFGLLHTITKLHIIED